jgi:hypothetical protein
VQKAMEGEERREERKVERILLMPFNLCSLPIHSAAAAAAAALLAFIHIPLLLLFYIFYSFMG